MDKIPIFLTQMTWIFIFITLSSTAVAYVKKRSRDYKETASNMLLWAVGKWFKSTIVLGWRILALSFFSQFALMEIPINWMTLILVVLVADFLYYWKHYSEHMTRFFWCFHVVHHSSHEYNLSTSWRLPWFTGIFDWVFWVPAVLVGFEPVFILLGFQIVLLFQFWIHTEKIGKLGWLDKVFNTPSNHRVHHASNPKYIDRNHGGIFVIFDHLFGTYQAEEEDEKVIYGITTPINTQNPIKINIDEPLALWRDIRQAQSLGEILGYMFRPPGWQPKRLRIA